MQRITEKELIGVIYENKVYFTRMARRFLHSDADVEDVIQETIYRAFKSFNTLNELAYLKTWLTRILINQCINLLRKSPPAPITTAVETGAKDANYHKTEIRQLVEMLEQDLREVAILYYYEDLPQKEIAAVLNVPVGTVKSRLKRNGSQRTIGGALFTLTMTCMYLSEMTPE